MAEPWSNAPSGPWEAVDMKEEPSYWEPQWGVCCEEGIPSPLGSGVDEEKIGR